MLTRVLPRNEHMVDWTVRVLLGLGLLALYLTGPRTPWGLLGIVPLFTGLVGSCPVYSLLGIRTCSRQV